MKIAIVGRPRSGKSTVFDVLTAGSSSGSSSEMRIGQAELEDLRLDRLFELFPRDRKVPVALQFVDVPGRSLEDARKADLGRDVLQPIRSADALLLVLRAFPDPFDPGGRVDPRADAQELLSEMVVLDQIVIQRRLERLEKDLQRNRTDELIKDKTLMDRCAQALDEFLPLFDLETSRWEEVRLRGYQFFTAKPMVAVVNAGDDPAPTVQIPWGIGTVGLQARLEQELSELEPEEREEFARELGLQGSQVQPVLQGCLEMTDRIVFYTLGDDEIRAWWTPGGSNAVEAAGRIHTDMARGFIRAEVIAYSDLAACDFSEVCARESGRMRVEGKSYIVQDGDILKIRFQR